MFALHFRELVFGHFILCIYSHQHNISCRIFHLGLDQQPFLIIQVIVRGETDEYILWETSGNKGDVWNLFMQDINPVEYSLVSLVTNPASYTFSETRWLNLYLIFTELIYANH